MNAIHTSLLALVLVLSLLTGPVQAACNVNLPATIPDGDFTLNADGTAVHDKTGLMWMRCELEQTWNGTGCDDPDSFMGYIWSASGVAGGSGIAWFLNSSLAAISSTSSSTPFKSGWCAADSYLILLIDRPIYPSAKTTV